VSGDVAKSACERIDLAFSNPEANARAFKDAGGKVVAFLGATVPVEIIAAGGAYPLRLKGGSGDTALADELMEPVRELYLRRIFNRLLAGALDWVDLIVVPRSSEGLLQFYYLIDYARKFRGHTHMPKVVLLDLLQTPFDYTIAYNKARLTELKAEVEAVTGRTISDEALAGQIKLYNSVRGRFRNVIEQQGPSGTLRLKLASFGQTQPAAEFESLLADLWLGSSQVSKGARVALSGSPHETADLYEIFASSGLDIVAEDHDWGAGIYAHDVAENADPIAALEEHYRLHGISMRQFVRAKPEYDVSGKDVRPEAVAFYFEENDDTLGWEYPDERKRLADAGIATALLRGPVNSDRCLAALKDLADQFAARTEGGNHE